jgi:hypothetical protein
LIDIRKSMFFDKPAVLKSVGKATRKALSKAGAFVRQAARTSIRPGKGTSEPGKPPKSHVGFLRRMIFFGYDSTSESVVVGPAKLNRSTYGSTTTPELLEYGGSVVADGRVKRYQGNPYMGPALKKEAKNFPALWRNSVR